MRRDHARRFDAPRARDAFGHVDLAHALREPEERLAMPVPFGAYRHGEAFLVARWGVFLRHQERIQPVNFTGDEDARAVWRNAPLQMRHQVEISDRFRRFHDV